LIDEYEFVVQTERMAARYCAPMSKENVELVRRGIESVNVFWGLLDDHVVWHLGDRPLIDLDGVYVGRDAVIEATRRYWGTWDDYSLDAEEVIDAGSSVVVVVHERGRGKGSGAPFDDRWAQVWTFSRGRIVRWELFNDRAAALAAAGVSA
jgi:ketosteroid isomerase-like protein